MVNRDPMEQDSSLRNSVIIIIIIAKVVNNKNTFLSSAMVCIILYVLQCSLEQMRAFFISTSSALHKL